MRDIYGAFFVLFYYCAFCVISRNWNFFRTNNKPKNIHRVIYHLKSGWAAGLIFNKYIANMNLYLLKKSLFI